MCFVSLMMVLFVLEFCILYECTFCWSISVAHVTAGFHWNEISTMPAWLVGSWKDRVSLVSIVNDRWRRGRKKCCNWNDVWSLYILGCGVESGCNTQCNISILYNFCAGVLFKPTTHFDMSNKIYIVALDRTEDLKKFI